MKTVAPKTGFPSGDSTRPCKLDAIAAGCEDERALVQEKFNNSPVLTQIAHKYFLIAHHAKRVDAALDSIATLYHRRIATRKRPLVHPCRSSTKMHSCSILIEQSC
jgi:hypothetical protein